MELYQEREIGDFRYYKGRPGRPAAGPRVRSSLADYVPGVVLI